MTLKHVKEYLETIERFNGCSEYVIENHYIMTQGGYMVANGSGYITSYLQLTIPERIRILEELQRPEDKKKVSEYLLETGKFKEDDQRSCKYTYIETEKGTPFYFFLSNSGNWDICLDTFMELSGNDLFIIAEVKKQLEEGSLVHG